MVGVVAVLLVSGVASAQTTDIAALANAGDATAQNRLGHAYFLGQGMPQDYVGAHRWYNLAASRATSDDQKRYAGTRDEVATQMTPAQIAEAQRLAREWQAAFDARQE